MSKADIDRFLNDLNTNAELQAEVRQHATSVSAAVEIAHAHGYDITLAEAMDHIRAQQGTGPLSDEDLDAVAGGKGNNGSTTSVAATKADIAVNTYVVTYIAVIGT